MEQSDNSDDWMTEEEVNLFLEATLGISCGNIYALAYALHRTGLLKKRLPVFRGGKAVREDT